MALARDAARPRPSCTSRPTRSRSSSARGVGTSPRPARTSSGSPVASRSRASARLIADGLSRSRRPARGDAAFRQQHVQHDQQAEVRPRHATTVTAPGMASNAMMKCIPCVFRHAKRQLPSPREPTNPRYDEPRFRSVGACRPRAVDAAVLARHQHRQCRAPDPGARAFTAPFQAVQWIVLAYLLAITASIVSAGRLGDIVGRRRLLLAGIWLFTPASLVCGVAPTLWLVIVARAAQGLGAAVMMALTIALVGEIVPKANTGRAMGLLGNLGDRDGARSLAGRCVDRRVGLAGDLPGHGPARPRRRGPRASQPAPRIARRRRRRERASTTSARCCWR